MRAVPKKKKNAHSRPSAVETLENRHLLSGGPTLLPDEIMSPDRGHTQAAIQGINPSEISSLYGFNQVSFGSTPANGAGQTIALIDATYDPAIVSDLGVFDKAFGLAAPPSFKQISQSGGSATKLPQDASWDGEIALDVEWAHAMAPGANIVLVNATQDDTDDLMAAVNTARNLAGVSVVSMSWGGSEWYGQTAYDPDFTTPAGHIPVTFVAAAGDGGEDFGPEWPASSTNVLGVGGTTIATHKGHYAGEVGWTDTSGGNSTIETTPSFQTNVAAGYGRSAPDVSYVADPNTGFAVYDSVPYQGYVGWQVEGGTSAGAPAWAAIIAIADQGRVLDGKTTLDGPSETLPTLYDLYNSKATYAANFNDVGAGNADPNRDGGATAGYDQVTGLGTPKANAVVASLVASSVDVPAVAPTPVHHHHAIYYYAADLHGAPVSALPIPQSSPALVAPSARTKTLSADRAIDAAVFADSVRLTTQTYTASSNLFQTGITLSSPPSRMASLGAATNSASVTVMPAIGSAVGSVRNFVTSLDLGAPVLAGNAVGQAVFSFPHLDAIAAFTDGLAAFADESANLHAIPLSRQASYHLTRAWVVTAGVLVLDAIILGHWYAQRRKFRWVTSTKTTRNTEPDVLCYT